MSVNLIKPGDLVQLKRKTTFNMELKIDFFDALSLDKGCYLLYLGFKSPFHKWLYCGKKLYSFTLDHVVL